MLVVFNVLGSKSASRFQIVFTVCKLIPLFLLMIFGFILGEGGNPVITPLVAEDKQAGAVFGSTLLAVLFAFEGWTNVGAIAGEMKNPGKDLPRAIVGGVYVVLSQILWSGAEATKLSIGSIVATLIGLPVYLIVKNYYKSKEA